MTASGVIRAISVTPFLGYKTVVFSLTNWNVSLSPEQINTSNPSVSAFLVRVAITSSASNPGNSKRLIPKAFTTS
ncbi:unannotated protein [freshwater metagenome]|uniref:Unannotated protein n=1 Tax=freshwater metagenome TaxID=449393 RepID=A0A6J6DRL8_9ZZZZ